MENQKIEEIRNLANSIDMRINLFEGFSPKCVESYKGEVLFWRQIVNIYGLFADCDRVQVKEKQNLIELMKRYDLLKNDEYKFIRAFWKDVSDLRKWFCHNNDNTLYFTYMRKNNIEDYLKKIFLLLSDKPASIELIKPKDWDMMNFNIESRFAEYLKIMKKALIAWKESQDKVDLINEWIEIQSKALFSDKELIQNALVEIAQYEVCNQGLYNTTPIRMMKIYYKQLEKCGFSEVNIANEMKRVVDIKRTNKEIIQNSIRNAGLID